MQTIDRNKFKFNPDKLVWRICEKSYLIDESKQPIKYDNEEENHGLPIILPKGAKVVNIMKDEKDDKLTKILCYWKGKYREGYIPTFTLDKYYKDFDDNSVEIFFNDVDHLLNDRLKRYTLLEDTQILYQNVVTKCDILRRKKISKNEFQKLYDTYCRLSKVNRSDKVRSLNTILENIFKTYNPKDIDSKILVMPISEDWFLNSGHLELRKFYTKKFLDSENGEFYDIFKNGNVGDNINEKSKREKLFRLLIELRDLVIKNNIKSIESNWLKTTNFSMKIKKTESILALGNDVWEFDPKRRIVQSSSVAQDDFFGKH